jgi:hypothetical protein
MNKEISYVEDYCSRETCNNLREHGYNGNVCTAYDEDGYTMPAITIQSALKWLRKEHNLFVEIQCYGCEADKKSHFEYSYVIYEFVKIDNKICTNVGLEKRKGKSKFMSPEEAAEDAVTYCLENLI